MSLNEEEELKEKEEQEVKDVDYFLNQEEESKETFAAPFGYNFGSSSIDLSLRENHDNMVAEYDRWWKEKGKARSTLQE